MSNSGIIHKTRDDGRVVHRTDNTDTDQTNEWLKHVCEYNIFTDVQARLLADALIAAQVNVRNDCQKEIDDQIRGYAEGVAEGLAEYVVEKIGSLPDEVRILRERVATLEGQIKAMTDLKGVPGKQGERGARGEQGRPGIQGEKGDVGPCGAAGPRWAGTKIESFDLITVLSDGTFGPRISLKQMFEDFARQQMLTGSSLAAAEPRLMQDQRSTLLTIANNET
jgi:hypothetical protein